eukprot:8359547-Heterocapsa_arctica.AAC.2
MPPPSKPVVSRSCCLRLRARGSEWASELLAKDSTLFILLMSCARAECVCAYSLACMHMTGCHISRSVARQLVYGRISRPISPSKAQR